ncbi:unnamed protein product [Gongylonema pulchrum]|uniref:XPGI domain-containing protein n=1 Tax=Gongylonema pulchrum TaxID=637853 RepID=A0A3P7NJ59_9BILA|nr:unnamed protein product [Gongylonema pulchrum]
MFGANVVYRNMFNQKRQLQMYSSRAIQDQLGLSRWESIQIALLSGGDYTDGLQGIGVVSALELIAEFATARQIDVEPEEEAFENLKRISLWMNRSDETATVSDDVPSSSSACNEGTQSGRAVAQKSRENSRRLKLRRLIERNNDAETLESVNIFFN